MLVVVVGFPDGFCILVSPAAVISVPDEGTVSPLSHGVPLGSLLSRSWGELVTLEGTVMGRSLPTPGQK